MSTLIAGLVLLLGTHSLRFFDAGWREAGVARLGERGWKALYAVVSLVGLVLIIIGFGATLGHPMVAGVKSWAFGHLVGNGTLAGIVLFGAILLWSIYAFGMLRRRDRAAALVRAPGRASRDVIAVVVGVVAALVFALLLHGPLIGLRPFG